ncbi:cytochrome P450 52A5 [Tuber magnatum]|uniref:Cytochrome P450 52A5 n=1 Tax=Tuber magnatum TaxID=42249 RepID=A0A317SG65_9PEZI|nr:cytochrome P450 52A5 [Tuber magnatum]
MLFGAITQSVPALLIALAVVGVLTPVFKKVRGNWKIHELGGRAKPVPSRWFLFGLDVVERAVVAARANKYMELWEGWFKIAGSRTIEISIIGTRAILTDDPENIKAVLASQFHDYGKGEPFRQDWKSFLGDSIFTTDGQLWHASRQLIRPQFVKDRVSDLDIFERHVSHMLEQIPRDGATVNVSDLFYRFTLDTATDFLLGQSIDSLGTPQVEFARAFADIQKHMSNKSKVGPMGWIFPEGKYKKDLKVLNSFVEPYVERALEMRPEELKSRNEKSYNFLHALAEFTRDKRLLRDQLVAVLLAARDSAAATLSWTLYEIARRPEVVQKLRAEILGRLGPNGKPTYADLKEMKYSQHVINEALRLYPAVPFNMRMSLKDTYLPRGAGPDGLGPVGMPKHTIFAYSALTMQRRVDLFGPDVEKFDPDRWENWTPKSWQYIPFNGGPRTCIGQQFALTEMSYVLVRMFQRFESVESRQTEEQYQNCDIVVSPGAGVPVSFKLAGVP